MAAKETSPNQNRAEYDLIIIGGGISGATVYYDACQRGLKTLLLEKDDFASGTSQATSRLIHGGLRYLKNLEFGLVRESLRERRILARIVPHALSPRSFFWPHYKEKKPAAFLMRFALWLYDVLSFDRNKNISSDLKIPAHRYMNQSEAQCFEAGTLKKDLQSAVFYYDYANHSPERLCYEFIYAAGQNGGMALNYSKVVKITKISQSYSIEYISKDRKRICVQSKTIVNVGGPWADLVNKLIQKKSTQHLIRSMGIHIVTRKIAGNSAVVLQRRDNSHLFILPLNGRSLIGTTDKIYKGHPDDFYVRQSYIEELIQDVNEQYEAANLTLKDVEYFYGGLRPLVEKDSTVSSYDTSRKLEIEDHAGEGLEGFFTVLGGKYTTSRLLAQKTIDQVCQKLGGDYPVCQTHLTPLPAGNFNNFHGLFVDLKKKFKKYDNQKIYDLGKRYGSLAFEMLAKAKKLPDADFVMANGEKYYPEEIEWIVKNEDIVHLDDLLFRRTCMGIFGLMEIGELKRLTDFVGKRKAWNEAVKKREMAMIKKKYVIKK